MIVARLKGGLGNQMFQYACARSLSLRCGAPLYMDAGVYAVDRRRDYLLPRFPRARLDPQPAGKALSPEPRLVEQPHFQYWPGIRDVIPPVILDGYWQTERYFSDHADWIREDFAEISALEESTRSLIDLAGKVQSVALHIRRGDYVDCPVVSRLHGALPLEYYHRAVTDLLHALGDPVFFVFSDDVDWVRRSIRFSAQAILVSREQGDPLADLAVMKACRHHVIANSSYSWWGAWLAAHEKQIVIAPSVWFAGQVRDTSDLLPDHWHRL